MNKRTVCFKNGKTSVLEGKIILFNPNIDKVRTVSEDSHFINQEEVLSISTIEKDLTDVKAYIGS